MENNAEKSSTKHFKEMCLFYVYYCWQVKEELGVLIAAGWSLDSLEAILGVLQWPRHDRKTNINYWRNPVNLTDPGSSKTQKVIASDQRLADRCG